MSYGNKTMPKGQGRAGGGAPELRDESLRHVVGAMPRALFVWSAVTLAAGIAVVVAAVRILLWRSLLRVQQRRQPSCMVMQ